MKGSSHLGDHIDIDWVVTCLRAQFRLGVITDEISLDTKRAMDVAKDLELECVELRQAWGKNIKDFADSELRKVRKMAKSAGLEIVCISSPLFKCDIDVDKEVRDHLRFLPRVVEITKFLDAELVRGFAFWIKEDRVQYWETIIDRINEAVDLCESEGVTFALENEHSTFTGTGKEARELAKEIDSMNLSLLWDPGNAFVAGEKPYPDGYLQVKDRMVHMHLKNVAVDPNMERSKFVAVGSGEIDYEGQFRPLAEDGYSGCISIETHYRLRGDGEGSTRETHRGIMTILEKLGITRS
jgi:sugar phosphate isomerase/epimerase